MEKKLVRVYTKITVNQINVFESTKTEYQNTKEKDEKGNDIWSDVEIPNQITLNETEEKLYEQKFEEGDLNVKELTLWANRVK